MAKSLDYYRHFIETAATFPPPSRAADRVIAADVPIPTPVPDPSGLSHGPTVALTGHLPDRRLTVCDLRPARPRGAVMDSETLLARITEYASRPDPYPLYAELRDAGPVVHQADGSYLIGGYHEIAALLHDPRMSAGPAPAAK